MIAGTIWFALGQGHKVSMMKGTRVGARGGHDSAKVGTRVGTKSGHDVGQGHKVDRIAIT